MRVRDPEGKKRQLLDSALSEFAAHGLAGTRVDAIAEGANCSAGLVYTYFGSKEALFDAVLDDIAVRTVELMPLTPEDLPDYAVRLYEAGTARPEIERFVAWYRLERDTDGEWRTAVAEAMNDKVAEVAAAQAAGVLATRMSAPELVLTVQAIARMWFTQPKEVLAIVDTEGRDRSEVVRAAVRTLLASS
jgi:AcrR family transcriptional regulator